MVEREGIAIRPGIARIAIAAGLPLEGSGLGVRIRMTDQLRIPTRSVAPYRNLVAWRRAMDLAGYVFDILPLIPRGARGALSSQLSRAAVSVPANIAEGYARKTPSELAKFLRIAVGSLREVETLLLLCERSGLKQHGALLEETWRAADETGRCLHGLIERNAEKVVSLRVTSDL